MGKTRPVEFVIARNPDAGSSLPFVIGLPVSGGLVLAVRDVWPRTSKLYCHLLNEWPDGAEVLEAVTVRSCEQRGAAIDLVLDRSREARSMFVFTKARGRDVIFWQSARTAKQARPNVTVPSSRAAGRVLSITVDVHERYPWTFSQQQASTTRGPVPVGDYAVHDDHGAIVAVVERKSMVDLVATLTGGKLRYVLAALAATPHAALVVEDRYSEVFKLERVRPSVVAEGIAEAQVRFSTVPIVFAETRLLAQEWTYRFFGAALAHHREHHGAGLAHLETLRVPTVREAATVPVAVESGPSAAKVRAWAVSAGLDVATKGRIRPEIRVAYNEATPS